MSDSIKALKTSLGKGKALFSGSGGFSRKQKYSTQYSTQNPQGRRMYGGHSQHYAAGSIFQRLGPQSPQAHKDAEPRCKLQQLRASGQRPNSGQQQSLDTAEASLSWKSAECPWHGAVTRPTTTVLPSWSPTLSQDLGIGKSLVPSNHLVGRLAAHMMNWRGCCLRLQTRAQHRHTDHRLHAKGIKSVSWRRKSPHYRPKVQLPQSKECAQEGTRTSTPRCFWSPKIEASHRSQEPQDGRCPVVHILQESHWLLPQGRILRGAYTQRPPEVPTIQMEKHQLPIYVPPLWSQFCTQGIYQTS